LLIRGANKVPRLSKRDLSGMRSRMNASEKSRFILASQSPRRQQLLEQVGLTFSVVPSPFDEQLVPVCHPEAYVKILAREKALAVAACHPESWVIGADTIVCIDGDILGKPGSAAQARSMLERLSGKTHQVYTGFAICCHGLGRMICNAEKTDVRFKSLSDAEITWYVNTKEPFDKAGGYAIQGLGTIFIKTIDGSYPNVVGLPVCEVMEILMREDLFHLDPAAA